MAPKVHLLLGSFLILQAMLLPHLTVSKPSGQPFKFIKDLEGCHRGQNVKGLHELKGYLKKFGYLNYNLPNDDDHIESAIKTYQLYYHLNVTGSLEHDTVKQMMMPRCGMPDFNKETTSGRPGNMKHHHSSNSPHTVSHYTLYEGKPKWTRTNLTYRFSSSVQVIDIQELRAICTRAFKRWADVTNLRFEEVQDGTAADMVIGFHRRDHGDNSPFDGPAGTVAHAYRPMDGRFHYDADETWGTNLSPEVIDLEAVAVHEIGHLLGLSHSQVPDAIMFATFQIGNQRRDLHADDIQGIRALYNT